MPKTSDHELIRNAIALCAIIYDTKDWPLFKKCLTDDIVFDYPVPLALASGLDDVTKMMRSQIDHLDTQHALTTQMIELSSDETATATTYCRAIHFYEGKQFFAEGRYHDKLVKIDSGEGKVRKISERKVVTMGVSQGDWDIFKK